MVKTELTDREKAIAAASLFEGEGCVYIRPKGDKRYTNLRLAMTDEDVVRRFCKWIGAGTVHKSDTEKNRSLGRKPAWYVRITKLDDVTRICGMIYPFLGKRRQEKIVDCLAADTRLA